MMKIQRDQIIQQLRQKAKVDYHYSKVDDTWVVLENENKYFSYSSGIRLQFDTRLSIDCITINIKLHNKEIKNLITEFLIKKYRDNINFNESDFYQNDYDFDFQEIKSEEHLEEYINEFIKCLKYHEKEVFPKLLDIRFLAEYVGSVPFERQTELPVGGQYPVSIFKKLAILKWGKQEEKYKEYKKGLALFIEEDFQDPKYGHEAPLYKEGFEKLIHHLENEPNPFDF